jgi:FkbM family methyltransferase
MYDIREHDFRTPQGNPILMAYREDTNDWNTLTATLTEDEYSLPSGLSGIALDIGGYLGSVGIALALDNPDLQVTVVEPVPPNADLIERNIAANRVWNRVHLVRGAVGKRGTLVSVKYGYLGNEKATHHAFVGNSTLMDPEDEDAVITLTYSALDIAALVGDDDVAFCKVDTEGGEYAFLDDPRGVAQLQTIVGEWHNVDGHVIGDIAFLLSPTHLVTFSGPQTGPGGFRAVRR